VGNELPGSYHGHTICITTESLIAYYTPAHSTYPAYGSSAFHSSNTNFFPMYYIRTTLLILKETDQQHPSSLFRVLSIISLVCKEATNKV